MCSLQNKNQSFDRAETAIGANIYRGHSSRLTKMNSNPISDDAMTSMEQEKVLNCSNEKFAIKDVGEGIQSLMKN